MGKFIKGILGGFSGKIGTVIGACWKGIDYMRSLPRKSSKPATQLQLDVRFKLEMIMELIRPIRSIINRGFQSAKGQSPMNAAMSYNLDNAITGVSPSFSVDFPEFMFSRGYLRKAYEAQVDTVPGAKIKFTWGIIGNSEDDSNDDDKVTVLIFNPAKASFVSLRNAALRSALTYTLQLPANFTGDDIHCYISFESANGKQVSDSAYIGLIPVMS